MFYLQSARQPMKANDRDCVCGESVDGSDLLGSCAEEFLRPELAVVLGVEIKALPEDRSPLSKEICPSLVPRPLVHCESGEHDSRCPLHDLESERALIVRDRPREFRCDGVRTRSFPVEEQNAGITHQQGVRAEVERGDGSAIGLQANLRSRSGVSSFVSRTDRTSRKTTTVMNSAMSPLPAVQMSSEETPEWRSKGGRSEKKRAARLAVSSVWKRRRS
jgi:hypothetical protein